MNGRELLRDWLRKSHTQQQTLAQRLGLSNGFLSQVLSGLRRPKLETLDQIQTLTGVPVGSWVDISRATSDRQAKPSAKRAVFTGRKSR